MTKTSLFIGVLSNPVVTGNTLLSIHGEGFQSSDELSVHFSTNSWSASVAGSFVSNYKITCMTPMRDFEGAAVINVSLRGSGDLGSTDQVIIETSNYHMIGMYLIRIKHCIRVP